MAGRTLRFAQKMTDAEAMMWTIEKDPRLSSNIGTITILDRPPDFDAFRMRIAGAAADIRRMRDRVAPVLGRLQPPDWRADPEFDLDFHVRRMALAPPGTDRQLYDLATTLMQEPFDRTRPLWLFIVIEGLTGGRAALLSKLHHTITDGEGGVRLAERYMEVERDAPPPSKVDLADAIVRSRDEGRRDGAVRSLARTAGHTLRRGLGVGRRTAGEAALAVIDPPRVLEGVRNVRLAARSALQQLSPDTPGSPVWTKRSRSRRYHVLDVPFAPAKDAAKALGGTLNDLFVTGATVAAVKYHDAVGADAPHFNATFVRSTREDRSAGGNAFTPSKVRVTGGPMELRDRLAQVRDAMAARNREAAGADLMGAVSGLANLLPTSVVTGIARDQAAAVDFATSNVRAAPFEVYVSGAKVLAPYPIGPVAGTAWNITMLSYAGTLCMGIHIDPVAVEQPELLVHCIEESFREILGREILGREIVESS